VVAYLNGQMASGGSITRFASVRIPAVPQTITVSGKPVTINAGQDSWALKIVTDPIEQVSLSAPTTGTAVYVGQMVGRQTASGVGAAAIPADAQSQLVKFQTDGLAITPPQQQPYATAGRVFVDQLGAAVTAVRATATSSDGSA